MKPVRAAMMMGSRFFFCAVAICSFTTSTERRFCSRRDRNRSSGVRPGLKSSKRVLRLSSFIIVLCLREGGAKLREVG